MGPKYHHKCSYGREVEENYTNRRGGEIGQQKQRLCWNAGSQEEPRNRFSSRSLNAGLRAG